jgi:hypothetical protein
MVFIQKKQPLGIRVIQCAKEISCIEAGIKKLKGLI